jgi:hypothetical protein
MQQDRDPNDFKQRTRVAQQVFAFFGQRFAVYDSESHARSGMKLVLKSRDEVRSGGDGPLFNFFLYAPGIDPIDLDLGGKQRNGANSRGFCR